MSIESAELLKMRTGANLSRRAVANSLGITEATLYNLETDCESNPTSIVLRKLADFYNVSTDYILGRETTKQSGDAA